MAEISKETKRKNQKYSRLLNNLLAIKYFDQALFTRINNIDCFDITTKFGKNVAKKILNKKEFAIAINEIDLEELLTETTKAQTAKEIIDAFNNKKEFLSNTKKILLEKPKTFETAKKELMENIIVKIQQSKNRWIQFRRKVIDANMQENIWQLHIATFFITLKTANKEIYAPMLLKEVSFQLIGNEITISSDGAWKVNEKLIFILNEEDYGIKEDIIFENQNAADCAKMLINHLNLKIEDYEFEKEFINLKREDINNKIIELKPGIALGMFKPAGGHLRKTLLEIIEKNEINNILNPDVNKEIYQKNIDQFLKNPPSNLFKIQKSNFSQDKALISSLLQDTVIWGPPGTGKSQVITNIIANLLINKKTAIIISQKKAALDVLKKRLGKLEPFVLFILNDNKMNKEEFYKPLQKFVELTEYSKINKTKLKNSNEKIITKKEIKSLKTIHEAKLKESYTASLELIETFKTNEILLSEIFNLSKNDYTYFVPYNKLSNYKQYENELAAINKINKKRKLFNKSYPDEFIDNAISSFNILLHPEYSQINLNKIIELAKKTNPETLDNLVKTTKNLKRENTNQSDEEYLANFLANDSLTTIKRWQKENDNKYQEYQKFANAVRAARRVPYKFINDHITIIKELFPIVITTPETSFINWEKNYFDYAILDESSQIFIEVGLPILYLAKIKILAGDTQQMQPTTWFMTRDTNENEEDVVENAESVLNYALDKGTYQVMLNQNFRSASASLMSFSAKHFYQSQLDVIDKNINQKKARIIVKNVQGEWSENGNEIEAEEVIQTIKKTMNDYQTIIILTFNLAQKLLIEKKIIENHPEILALIEDEKLTIRNIENVQGDEADLVIASIVYDKTTNMTGTYIARQGGKNALNVAISRAKEKMIVIKSVTWNTIKTVNTSDFLIFKNWLEFLDLNESDQKKYSIVETKNKDKEAENEVDSQLKKEIFDGIKETIKTCNNFKIVKQFEIGSKKIDIAIIDQNNKFKLGVNIDNYLYHEGNQIDKYLETISSQQFLTEKGYNIYSIKEIDWKLNKNKILKELKLLID